MKKLPFQSRGVAVISAIFLLVVLAALGAFMVTFSNTQQLTSAQDVRGTQAYWAARAGIDWAIPQVIASGSCPTATPTFTVNNFAVETSCSTSSFNDGVALTLIRVTALACQPGPCGAGVGSLSYVERSLSVTVEK
jgi:MSHA biogenesis protein MshP